jgi:hypothetical protein
MAASFCFRRGLRWGGSVGNAHLQAHTQLCQLLGLPAPHPRGGWSLLPHYYREQIQGSGNPQSDGLRSGALRHLDRLLGLRLLSTEFPLHAQGIYTTSFVTYLRSACTISSSPYTGKRVVMHIRRGDIKSCRDPHRYTSNIFYVQLLEELRQLLGFALHFTIHSQAQSEESFDCFLAHGAVLKLDTSIEEAWHDMIAADILVMSKSSFSYVPGVYNQNIVLYQPFWHGCLPWWINLGTPSWRDALLSKHQRLSS